MFELNEDNIIFLGTHLSGISSISEEFCAVAEDNDNILIFTLDDNDVATLVKQINKKQIVQIKTNVDYSQNKSILARGIVGGLVAGAGGAMLGALSAIIGSKNIFISFIETTSGAIIFESAF